MKTILRTTLLMLLPTSALALCGSGPGRLGTCNNFSQYLTPCYGQTSTLYSCPRWAEHRLRFVWMGPDGRWRDRQCNWDQNPSCCLALLVAAQECR